LRALIDSSIPFEVVYAIYHHEYLGYLISAHVVQLLENGELSYSYQGLHPENIEEFAAKVDDLDREAVTYASQISPRSIIKKFGGNPRKITEFFSKKFTGQAVTLAEAYIQTRLHKILRCLPGKRVFEMGNDGYPAYKAVKVLSDKASVLFHFRRKETHTLYFPTIKLRGQKVNFQFKNAVLVCDEPAWMLLHGELFSFELDVDGKKLKPFLKSSNIKIPREKEAVYYSRFITQLLEKYHVYAKGFEIFTTREEPTFVFYVQPTKWDSFTFSMKVRYGRFALAIDGKKNLTVVLDQQAGKYVFYRVKRHVKAEAEVRQLLEGLYGDKAGNNIALTSFPKDEGLRWLSENVPSLKEHGIEIVQPNIDYRLNLDTPEVVLRSEEAGDWFDIHAVVHIGSFRIPFVQFRSHIIKNQREFILPDGSIAILPETWFTDFRHLLEVSRKKKDLIRIKRYQVPLLESLQSNKKQPPKPVFSMDGGDLTIPSIDPPKGFKATLRSYQAKGLDWLYFMKEKGMGAILADDMGLGKTIQTLALLLKEKEAGIEQSSLVVLPTSLIHNWYTEAEKFAPKLKVHIHAGTKRNKDVAAFAEYNLVLTTYGLVRKDIEQLKTFPFHYVILDESQMIKNPSSKTAIAVKDLIAKYKLSITGTPLENTVMDIWSQMGFLNPGLLGSERFFKKFYVSPIEKQKNVERGEQLRRLIFPYILRRKKQQVESELPPKVEKIHYCDMGGEQKELYEKTLSTYRNYLLDLIHKGAWKRNKLNVLAGLQKLRQIAIHPELVGETEPPSGKYQEVHRLLKEIMQKGSKVLIFSQFVKMLHILRKDLESAQIPYCYLDGQTQKRQEQVRLFQERNDIPVFLISLRAGGVGLNLTAADYVFIIDPWWNPAVENQAIDRSHRIGQNKTVFYYKFITKDSIEEKILGLQQRKAKLSDNIITTDEGVFKSLTDEDLMGIVE